MSYSKRATSVFYFTYDGNDISNIKVRETFTAVASNSC